MIEEALRTFLVDNIADVAERVYAKGLPQNPIFPAISLFMVSDVPDHHMLGPSGLTTKRLQISCWDRKPEGGGYASVKALARQVQQLLDGYHGTLSGITIKRIWLEGARDLPEPETKTDHVALDFLITHDY
jgi:hypothetical protein